MCLHMYLHMRPVWGLRADTAEILQLTVAGLPAVHGMVQAASVLLREGEQQLILHLLPVLADILVADHILPRVVISLQADIPRREAILLRAVICLHLQAEAIINHILAVIPRLQEDPILSLTLAAIRRHQEVTLLLHPAAVIRHPPLVLTLPPHLAVILPHPRVLILLLHQAATPRLLAVIPVEVLPHPVAQLLLLLQEVIQAVQPPLHPPGVILLAAGVALPRLLLREEIQEDLLQLLRLPPLSRVSMLSEGWSKHCWTFYKGNEP